MRTTVLLLPTALLVLAACGASDDEGDDAPAERADDTPTETGAEGETDAPIADATTFSGELEDGTTLTVRLGVDESDPVVAPFVAFRERAGATDPVVWIVGSLVVADDFDDTAGPAPGRFLTFVPPGGELIDETNPISNFACSELDEWFGAPSGDGAQALNDAYLTIVDEGCNGQTLGVIAEAGATTDYAMVIEGDIQPDIEAVYAGLLTQLEPG